MVRQGHAAARPMFEALLAEAEGVLHSQHVTIIDCLMPLVNCCRAASAAPDCIAQPSAAHMPADECGGKISCHLQTASDNAQ